MSFLRNCILTFIFITSTSAFAKNINFKLDDCKKPATQVQEWNALQLSGHVKAQILELDRALREKGQKLKVVILGRMGTDPGKVVTLKDKDADGNLLSVDEIYQTTKDYIEDEYGGGWDDEEAAPTINEEIPKLFGDPERKLKYSHVGFAFLNTSMNKALKKQILVVHKLKPCTREESTLYRQGLFNFFLDDTDRYGAEILVPSLKVQERITSIVLHKVFRKAYHWVHYNAAAGAFQTEELNSNQFVLEVLAASLRDLYEVRQWREGEFRFRAQEILKKTGYRPSKLSLARSFLYSLLKMPLPFIPSYVNVKRANPYYMYDLVEVVTALSIQEYMERLGILELQVHVRPFIFKDDSKSSKADEEGFFQNEEDF